MALTTKAFISGASEWSGPYQNYDITAVATRSSSTDKAVTIEVTATIGFSKTNGIVGESYYGYGVQFKATRSSSTQTATINPSGTKWSMTSSSAQRLNNNGSTMTGCPQIKKAAIKFEQSSWTDGNKRDIDVSLLFNGTVRMSGTITLSMPDYSSSSGGDSGGSGGGGTTPATPSPNDVLLSISPTSITKGQSATLKITPKIGSGNGISKYEIYQGGNYLASTTSTSYTVYPTSSTSYYVVAISTKGSAWDVDSNDANITVKEVTPVLESARISPTEVSTIDGGGVFLYASSNTGYYTYYINNVYQDYDSAATVFVYPVYSGDKISVKAYNPSNGAESAAKTFTVGGYTPVSINSINISPQIIKNNISSPDLAKVVSGSMSYSGPASSITWYYRSSRTQSGLSSASWYSLGVSSSSFSNINMREKLNLGDYYQFRADVSGSYNNDYLISSDIFQIPAPPSAPSITKIIPKANPKEGYETITQDGKIFYGSGLFLTWTNPTVSDSQMPIAEIELIYSSKSSSDTSNFGEAKTAQITYNEYLENGTTYKFNNSFPYNATLPTGATGSGGGADLEVPSLHATMIGIRVTDELGEISETVSGTIYYKAESPSFGGNLIVSQNSFRPFTCNTNETFYLTSSVAQSNSQDALYYYIDCYVNDRKVTIPVIEKIPISTAAFSNTSITNGSTLYSDNNFTIKKQNPTTIEYVIKNSYLKQLLLAEDGLRTPKNNLSAVYNDDFSNVVYKVSVRDDFDSRSTVYNSNTISINFIEAPTLSNNSYLDIGVNRYLKSLNPFYDNSIIMATPTSTNNNRIVNPGESVIFKFKRAQDYNAADYISTMLGDVTQYNIYVSRNDEPVTSNYDKLTYTLLKSYLVEELKKALPSSSTDEYYYLEYPLQSYQDSKFVTFRIEAVDSKGMKSEYLYSNTYLVPCRATSMDFYLRTVDLDSDIGGVFLNFTTKVNDFGAATFINDLYGYETNNSYYSYPNYERQFTVNNQTFTRKGRLIFEATLDGNFNNKNIAALAETQYNNYFNFTKELTDYLLPNSTYLDIIGKENNLNGENNSIRIYLPESWQKTNETTGKKELADELDKIFFRVTYEITYGFKDLNASDYEKYLTVISTTAPYSYYEDAPTVSYRNHQVGINTKDFQRNSEIGQNEVLIIQDNGSYNLVVFKGAEQKITLDLRARTFTATKNDSEETVSINFGSGTIEGMILDGGEWI